MSEILRHQRFVLVFLICLFGAASLFSRDGQRIERFSGFTMGTSYEVQLADIPSTTDEQQIRLQVSRLLNHLDLEIFSTYAENSELSRFNRHEVDVPFIASDHLLYVLVLAKEIAEYTNGAFDVTVGPLVNLWGFGPDRNIRIDMLPTEADIEKEMTKVGISNLIINQALAQIQKSSDIYVDLSGIAKGYAVDQIASLLQSNSVDNYFIEVGGEIKVSGEKFDGQDWVPAIEAPQVGSFKVYEVLRNRGDNIALAGSGDYRNFFAIDGVRYSHEIDPRSGKPVSHNLAAAFVIDTSAAAADAYATALMVLGLERSKELIEQIDIEAYLIFRTSNSTFAQYISPGFMPYLND